MDPTKFVAPAWGRAVSTGGAAAFHAFVPMPVPRELVLDPETIMPLSDADAALGRLAGAGRLRPDPHLLVNACITREAVASSRIEGTQASVTEVFDTAVTATSTRADIQEVRNYIAALEHGLRRLSEGFPMSLRLIKEMHERLLTDVRGQERTPGEFRLSQNWISSPDNRPCTARFVPPAVDEMCKALDDWEKYLHDDQPKLPPLIRSRAAALPVRDDSPIPRRQPSTRPGFPNYFTIFGPYGYNGSSYFALIEAQSARILRVLKHARRKHANWIEVTQDANDRYFTEMLSRRFNQIFW